MKNSTAFDLIHNANVVIEPVPVGESHIAARALINDTHQYVFPVTSRITKALSVMTPEDLGERLSGGSFFFIGDQLADFRDGQYNGFCHSRDSISKMMDLIGFHTKKNGLIDMANVYSKNDFQIQGYKEGGDFTSQLSYKWSPFHQNIRAVFELVRQICTNGMIGTTDFFNARIPVVNRWEEHMDIASRQIQNKVNEKMTVRLEQMGDERATVSDLNIIHGHALQRLDDLRDGKVFLSTNDYERTQAHLNRILKVVDPEFHLGNYYKAEVFENSNLGAQVPGHLTMFDAWNLVTEMSTHTPGTEKSSGTALQRLANSMVFDIKKRAQRANRAALTAPMLSSFSDPEVAFFGETDVVVA